MHAFERGEAWTVERKQMLGKLWADGLSASRIANELGGGVSRSAVLGQVYRLDLPKRTSVFPRKNIAAQAADRRARRALSRETPHEKKQWQRDTPERRKRVQTEAVKLQQFFISETTADLTPEQLALTVTLVNLRPNTCRWPFGNPAKPDFCFCGIEPQPESPYCAPHHRLAHQSQRAPSV